MRFILRRLGFYAIALWGAITLNFLLPRLMPGSPLDGLMSRISPAQLAANPNMVENLREYLNVQEEPFFQAYWHLPRTGLHRGLRHLDLELPDARLRRRRANAPLLRWRSSASAS